MISNRVFTPGEQSAVPNILSIAGTDPTGGAGVQADLKSIAANGGYGMAVVTALVAQNTLGVRSVHRPPIAFLDEQLTAVSDDVQIDGVKIGMLASSEVAQTVHGWLREVTPPVVVLDPVMIATSGDRLLDAEAEEAVRGLLYSVDICTPNIPELAVLARSAVATDWNTAIEQALAVSAKYSVRVLAKGGHLLGATSPDALVNSSSSTPVIEFSSRRVPTQNTHGTGCSLSSAIATLQPRTGDWEQTILLAKEWLVGALSTADELRVGRGHGPINHFAALWAATTKSSTLFQQRREPTVSKTITHPSSTNFIPKPTEIVAVAAITAVAGSVTGSWWARIADIRSTIMALPFVKELGSGNLNEGVFRLYLAQDALYLRDYSRILARASELAPTPEEQVFWAQSAINCIENEQTLHRDWLGTEIKTDSVAARAQATAATSGYLAHLTATAQEAEYARVIAALLPCFWLYHDVGTRLHTRDSTEHPYTSWLQTYADPAFAESTKRAIAYVECAASASEQPEELWNAFRLSSEWELQFFAAALAPD